MKKQIAQLLVITILIKEQLQWFSEVVSNPKKKMHRKE